VLSIAPVFEDTRNVYLVWHLTFAVSTVRIHIMPTVNQTEIKMNWAARGFSCDLWIDPPGRVWSDFVHDTDELVMLVEGEEEFEMEGRKHRLEIGEELLIPTGAYHTARNVGNTTSKWLYDYKRK
jgi:mannose-6-phosphate isomerase-like protein (cupin superfamily)